jgi:hypothetical protein
MKTPGAVLAAASLVAFVQPAQAAIFTLTGGGGTFTFSIADSPTPDSWFDGVSFVVYDVPAPSVSGLVDVTLYNKDWFDVDHRSLQIEDYNAGLSLYELFGAQLYSGLESSPTFKHGNFQLQDARGNPYSLTIASDVAAVPEPGTWAMMIAGLGMAGFALRRRTRITATATFA